MLKSVVFSLSAYVLFSFCTPAMAANPRFSEVGKKLDPEGSFYLYMDVKDQIRRVFEEAKKSLLSATSEKEDLQTAITIAEKTLDTLGLFAIEDVGISSAKVGEIHRSKFYVRVPGERKGLFKVLGGEPHDWDALKYPPADTVLFRAADLDLAALYDLARAVMEDVGGAIFTAEFDKQVTSLNDNFGLDVEKLLRSLNGTFMTVVTLDSTQKIAIPGSGEPPIQVPLPKAALLVGTRDETLYTALTSLIGTPEQKEKTTDGKELKRTPLPVGPSEDFPFSPQIAFDGTNVILSSHADLVDAMVHPEPGSARLAAQKNFQELLNDLPPKGNDLVYISPRIGQEMKQVLDQLTRRGGGQVAGAERIASFLDSTPLAAGFAAARVNELGGLYVVTTTTSELGLLSSLSNAGAFLSPLLEDWFPSEDEEEALDEKEGEAEETEGGEEEDGAAGEGQEEEESADETDPAKKL